MWTVVSIAGIYTLHEVSSFIFGDTSVLHTLDPKLSGFCWYPSTESLCEETSGMVDEYIIVKKRMLPSHYVQIYVS